MVSCEGGPNTWAAACSARSRVFAEHPTLPLMAQAKAKLRSFHAQRCDSSLHLLRDLGNRRPILRMLLEAPQVSGGPFTTGLLLLVERFNSLAPKFILVALS